ncbi:MAG: TerB family tellurite resistance protein [Paracoccaceae bacterium]
MFADLLKRLTQPEPAPLQDADARLALTALLVRIAKSDGDYADVEIELIEQLIGARYGLSASQVDVLRADAEGLEKEAPDTVRFTRAIKNAVPYVDREAVIEALWKIALADGERDAEENALLRLVADLLGINDRDSNIVRRRVEAQM